MSITTRWESIRTSVWPNSERSECMNAVWAMMTESTSGFDFLLGYSTQYGFCFSLEEDFMLWREGFWPAVCDFFDIRTVGEDISTRQYKLTVHTQYDPERVFKGEMGRLKSYDNQKP